MEAGSIYKSKVGVKIVLLCLIPLGAVTTLALIEKNWPTAIVLILITAFVIYLLTSIRYIIREKKLYVLGGLIFRRQINIQEISRIVPTKTWLAAPAASLDRLNLKGKFGSIIISPERKSAFIHHLKTINPDLQSAQIT